MQRATQMVTNGNNVLMGHRFKQLAQDTIR
jgi:hypothetical protein